MDMPIMPLQREDPIAQCRIIADSVLRALDEGIEDRGQRTVAWNSLFRLAGAMGSHRYCGMRDPAYARLVAIMDECAGDACGPVASSAWTRIKDALRDLHDATATDDDRRMVRAMAESMRTRLEHE